MMWSELLTKRQRKCRMTTKIPLNFREPTWCRDDINLGNFLGYSPNSPPRQATPCRIVRGPVSVFQMKTTPRLSCRA